MYICIYIYVYMYISIHMNTFVCICTCMDTFICICMCWQHQLYRSWYRVRAVLVATVLVATVLAATVRPSSFLGAGVRHHIITFVITFVWSVLLAPNPSTFWLSPIWMSQGRYPLVFRIRGRHPLDSKEPFMGLSSTSTAPTPHQLDIQKNFQIYNI